MPGIPMTKNDTISLDQNKQFEDWFKKIYESEFEGLYRFAFSITKHKPQAEDIVSDIFTAVWKNKPCSNSIEELKAYIYVSIKHLAIRVTSFSNSNKLKSEKTLQLVDTVNPEKLLLEKELNNLIDEVVDNLPPHTQLVYNMVMKQNYCYQKISEELGISKRTAEKHMSNAMGKLRLSLQKHLNTEEVEYSFFRKASSFNLFSFLPIF
ncbi:MAG: sigma-70 family RNA polymerase sigma factor [Cyclobacteriaceae bacterium]